jgi:uncharacterized protein YcbX
MLVDEKGTFISQRKFAKIALIKPKLPKGPREVGGASQEPFSHQSLPQVSYPCSLSHWKLRHLGCRP